MTSNSRLDEKTRDLSPADVLGTNGSSATWEFKTRAEERPGTVPFTADFLTNDASGYHFGMSQNAGMGWNPAELLRKQFAILSTVGGMRNSDGSPIALGLHTGHFELTSLVESAANELRDLNAVPFAMFCTDPCDGRSMGTTGMLDSLPYRNDAAQVFRHSHNFEQSHPGAVAGVAAEVAAPAIGEFRLAEVHLLFEDCLFLL